MAKKAKIAKATKKTAEPATKEASASKAGKGTRYSPAEKQKIVAFVEEVNSTKGRGGVAAAARKFGASPLSIGNWVRSAGSGSPAASAGKARQRSAQSGLGGVLSELSAVYSDIAKKRSELEALEARFNKLKAAL